jgi:hypothetical protein
LFLVSKLITSLRINVTYLCENKGERISWYTTKAGGTLKFGGLHNGFTLPRGWCSKKTLELLCLLNLILLNNIYLSCML